MPKKIIRQYFLTSISLIFVVVQSSYIANDTFTSTFSFEENLTQEDLNGDNRPDIAYWQTQRDGQLFAITVYDGGKDMKWSSTWFKATDFTNDTWLFDSDADDSLEIIIRFKTIGPDRYQALIWDDRDGDQRLSVQFNGTGIEILESFTPRLIVESSSNWINKVGNLTGNLTFTYDGILDSEKINYPRVVQDISLIDYDGNFDFQTIVVDHNDNGVIDYVHSHISTEVPIEFHIPREGMKVNEGQQEPTMIGETFYWPLFNYNKSYLIRNYFDSPPFVAIDWIKARIVNYGIAGYPIEEGFHINNLNSWKKEVTNHANFENMMAYYDLANNNDGLPELHIRNVYWPHRNSLYFENPSMDVNEIVYSWRHQPSSHLDWDYKLSLAGSKSISSIVDFEDFSLYLVPYLELPAWAIYHDWMNTTFVATEDRDYASSEGIYEWSTTEGVINDFLQSNILVPDSMKIEKECVAGLGPCSLSQLFTDIAVGLRGEYKSEQGQPLLYFSSIDQRLHLRGAELGLWRLSPDDVLKYSDQSEDGIFDTWLFVHDNVVQAELRYSPPFLVFTQNNQILIKKSDVPPIQFEVTPPTNHEEWQNLSITLAPFWENKPNEIAQMFGQVSGAIQILKGATLSDFRTTATGYRFVLTIQSNFQNLGNEFIPSLDSLPKGIYVVTYDYELGSFLIESISPPTLFASIVVPPLTHLQPAFIQVSAGNQGLQDMYNATLEIWANPLYMEATIVDSREITLLAQESVTSTFQWTPPSDGVWILTPKIRQPDGHLTSGEPVSFVVAALENENPLNSLFVSMSPRRLPVILLSLIVFAAVAALVSWHAWAQPLVSKVNDETQYINPKRNEITGRCPYCQAQERQSKAGFNRSGSQRHRCGQCKRVYTPNPNPKGYTAETRRLAIQLHMDGNSYKAVGRVLKVSPQSVVKWVKLYRSSLSAAPTHRKQSTARYL